MASFNCVISSLHPQLNLMLHQPNPLIVYYREVWGCAEVQCVDAGFSHKDLCAAYSKLTSQVSAYHAIMYKLEDQKLQYGC